MTTFTRSQQQSPQQWPVKLAFDAPYCADTTRVALYRVYAVVKNDTTLVDSIAATGALHYETVQQIPDKTWVEFIATSVDSVGVESAFSAPTQKVKIMRFLIIQKRGRYASHTLVNEQKYLRELGGN
jgi:hypothetical protein